MALEESSGQAHPAGHAVIEVDDRAFGMGRADLAHQAEIARVAHEQDAGHGLHRAAGADERKVELVAPPVADRLGFERQPVGRRMELDLGQEDAAPAEVLERLEAQLLVDGGDAADHHLAMAALATGRRRGLEALQRLERDRQLGLRVVVHVDRSDIGLLLAPVEPIHVVLARLVEVDGALVDEGPSGEEVDLADDPRPITAGLDDDHVHVGARAQRHLRGGEVLARPVPATVRGLAHVALLAEEGEQLVCRLLPESLAWLERQLEGRRPQVRQEDVQVLRIEACLLRAGLEEQVGVGGHVLVDRIAGRHEDGRARLEASAGPPDALPGGGDGTRVAGQHGRVEPADVEAQLEGVRAHHAEHLAAAQSALDGPPLGRQIAAPIATHPADRAAAFLERIPEPGQHELHGVSGAAEDDGLAIGAQEAQGAPLGEPQRTGADAQPGVDDRRVEDEDALLAGRRAVAVDEGGSTAGERRRQLLRIADGRRAGHDDRVAAVVRAQAEEAPQDVGHVAAEDPAVGVRLVDDDEAQLFEELVPLRVVRQDGGVEHVRVGDHDLAGGADRLADGRRRVAVVDARREVDACRLGEGTQAGQLVLSEGLGREQVERPRRRVVEHGLQHGQVVAQGLARRRRGDDTGVQPGMQQLERLRLVAVERLDAARPQAGPQPLIEPRRERTQVGLARRQGAVGDHRSRHEWIIEQALDDRRHAASGRRSASSASNPISNVRSIGGRSLAPSRPCVNRSAAGLTC